MLVLILRLESLMVNCATEKIQEDLIFDNQRIHEFRKLSRFEQT